LGIDDTVRAHEVKPDVGEEFALDCNGMVGGRQVPYSLERRGRARRICKPDHEIQVSEHAHREVAIRGNRQRRTLDCNQGHAGGPEGIDYFNGAAGQMAGSQRVYFVAQTERTGQVARQISSAFGAETRTNHWRYAVAIGENEKSIPINAALDQLRHWATVRESPGYGAAAEQEIALDVRRTECRRIHFGPRALSTACAILG
jgi:hypothetical protein